MADRPAIEAPACLEPGWTVAVGTRIASHTQASGHVCPGSFVAGATDAHGADMTRTYNLLAGTDQTLAGTICIGKCPASENPSNDFRSLDESSSRLPIAKTIPYLDSALLDESIITTY